MNMRYYWIILAIYSLLLLLILLNLSKSNYKGIIDMVLWNAQDYEKFTNGRVKINVKTVPTMPALFEEIESDARNGGGEQGCMMHTTQIL